MFTTVDTRQQYHYCSGNDRASQLGGLHLASVVQGFLAVLSRVKTRLSLERHLSGSPVLFTLNCFAFVSSCNFDCRLNLDFLSLVEGSLLVYCTSAKLGDSSR